MTQFVLQGHGQRAFFSIYGLEQLDIIQNKKKILVQIDKTKTKKSTKFTNISTYQRVSQQTL